MDIKKWLEQLLEKREPSGKDKETDKTKWILVVLVGLLLLVIAMPTGSKKKTEEKAETQKEEEAKQTAGLSEEKSRVEAQLEKMLSAIDGAGSVQVMITYKDGGTRVVEKDVKTSSGKTTETDSSGGTREVSELDREEETVYDSGNGEGEPFVTKELTPEIEGILVVAEGGNKTVVRQNISNAILALFPVEAHKIVVVKRND